jgi:hypothetical protein
MPPGQQYTSGGWQSPPPPAYNSGPYKSYN